MCLAQPSSWDATSDSAGLCSSFYAFPAGRGSSKQQVKDKKLSHFDDQRRNRAVGCGCRICGELSLNTIGSPIRHRYNGYWSQPITIGFRNFRLPIAHIEDVGNNPRARLELPQQLRRTARLPS